MARLVRAHDWASTPIGAPRSWPQPLRTLVGVMMGSNQPMFVAWGPERTLIYNDPYAEILAGRHPGALGRPLLEVWDDVRDDLLPIVETAFRGEPVQMDDITLVMNRRGYPEEAHFAFSYTPVRDEGGAIAGFFCTCQEITRQILTERRLSESEARYRTVLEASTSVIWTADASGAFVTRQPTWEAYTGQLWPEHAGFGWAAMLHPEDRGRIVTAWREVVERQEGPYSTDGRVWHAASGSYHHFIVRAVPMRDDDGALTEWVGTITDIQEQKRTEELLREATRRFDAILSNTREAVFLMDHRQHCVYANAAAEALTGYSFEELQGRPLHDVIHHKKPDGSHYPLEECPIDRAFPARAQMSGEELFVARDGSFYPVAFTASPVLDDAGKPVATVIEARNIAAEKAQDAALRESEERFRNMADHAPVMMWVTRPDGVCTYLNPQWHEFTGQTEEEALGFGWLEATHPDDRAEVERAFFEANARHAPFRVEYRLRRADGVYRWSIDAAAPRFGPNGEFLGYVGSVIDIDERRDIEDRLRTLTNTVPAFVWFGGPDGAIQHLNDRWYEYTGQTPEEAVPHGWAATLHPDDADHVQAAWSEALAQGTPYEVECRYRRADGVHRWYVARAEPVRDPLGMITGWVGTSLDIDDRVRAEDALRELNETLEARVAAAIAEREQAEAALRQAQKMEAVGQLTGGIAHDFNNMLAAIMGSLDLLGRRIGDGDARARRYVDAAMEGTRRAALLTQRLLAFSRQQPLKPEPTDVNRLVQGMSDLLGRSLGPGVQIETVLAGGLWRAHADPHQLENVVLNLALNARDAMPEGGRLTIETGNAHLDSRYAAEHLGVPAGQYVQIAVSDTGDGMTPEVAARAFDPFYTTKPVGQGTGLGLSQVYGFVKQSGGHVKIYSEPGQGTTVKIYLPRLMGPQADEPVEEVARDLPRGEAQEVVLVVEDEPMVRRFTVEAVSDLGYRVLEADGAAAALRLLDAHPEVDLLFTDIVMPETDGRRLADEALRRRPELKVLFTTGYTRNAVVHNGVLDPGVHLLGKPFTVEDLAAKLREVLDGVPVRA